MRNLAERAGLELTLLKIRGDNGHHICESAFKALSRAIEKSLGWLPTRIQKMTPNGASTVIRYAQGLQLQRSGKVERKTKETFISVEMNLDGGDKGVSVETGIPTLE